MVNLVTIPATGLLRLQNAQVPGCLLDLANNDNDLTKVDINIDIDAGKITSVQPGGTTTTSIPVVDIAGRQVWPGLVDLHTHLDKSHIWPRCPNPDGTFTGALTSVEHDRTRNWSTEDVRARMEFSLRCAYAHGTVAVRTHLDSLAPQHRISWPVFCQLREAWADRITLQAVNLVTIDKMHGDFATEMADLVATSQGILGLVTYPDEQLQSCLELTFNLAEERGLDLDFHVDESLDPESNTLATIAETALRLNFSGHIVVGHCCSLSVQAPELVADTLIKVADANIQVVSLPMCNLYLQDRVPHRTPRRRGVTLLHEMAAAGIPVALASDNNRDPFYAYGDMDLLEVFTQAVRIAHLDHPIAAWPRAVCTTPAQAMRLPADRGMIKAGVPADLIICQDRSFSEVLSRPQSHRIVLRQGRMIDNTPPDYHDLDFLFHSEPRTR